jgi:hypothetical protein
MSTIASPRPSIASSSRRNSASTDTTITSTTARANPSAAERAALRRNRSALRDYYNIKKDNEAPSQDGLTVPTFDGEQESELDKPGFDPEAYVERLLSHESLEAVLRVEAGLVSDIFSLDGEKKALVYDNYSKLIAATDTIRNMREKMDPMTPTTSTLSPAIGHIAETAARLSADLSKSNLRTDPSASVALATKRKQQESVRWVLGAPDRIRELVEDDQRDAAETEWQEISEILSKWEGVKGTEEVRQACLEALKKEDSG